MKRLRIRDTNPALRAAIILAGEIVVLAAIIKYVPYTKIDWDAYMSQATTGNSLLQKDPDSPPANRFSVVIEKIERLYKGDESSEEEQLDKGPDDDQYDTEDSFIDDTKMDEYFSVDNAKTKHTGFFVNRGKLEPVNEPDSPVPTQEKRKRKDIKKAPNAEDITKKLKMGNL